MSPMDRAMGRAKRAPAAVALLLAALALAGCEDDAAPAKDDPAIGPAPPATGSLRVVVVTPDLHPIAGALVRLAHLNASTDGTGAIRLDGLAAGPYVLHVQKPGFRDATQGVEVVANQAVEARVKLLPAPATSGPGATVAPATAGDATAYEETFHLQGYFDCSATYLIITGDCMLVLDTAVDAVFGAANETPPARPGDATREEFVLEFPLDHGWRTVVAEMHWETTTLAGERMTFAVEPAQAPADGHAAKYARAEGGSPLVVRLEPGVPHENATASADGEEPDMPNALGGEVLRTRSYVQGEFHRPGGTTFLGAGAAYQQKFDVYVTVFYGEAAPIGHALQG